MDPITLEKFDLHINHDRYRNNITVMESNLLDLHLLSSAMRHMEDIHRKVLAEAVYRIEDSTRYRSERRQASRTLHNQIAAILLRYYAALHQTQDAGYMKQLDEALIQAHMINLRAKYRVSRLNEERTKGNVRFVKSL